MAPGVVAGGNNRNPSARHLSMGRSATLGDAKAYNCHRCRQSAV
jgi:hypothetical protein